MFPDSIRDERPKLPTSARLADGVAITLGLVALWIAATGGGRYLVGGTVVSLKSPMLALYVAASIVIVRHLRWPRPTLADRFRGVRGAVRARPDVDAAVRAFIVTRPTVLLVGFLAVVTFGVTASGFVLSKDPLTNLPARFDAGWYGGIAIDGYEWNHTFQRQQNIAFFPALPILMRIVATPAGIGSRTLPDERRMLRALWAGVVVSLAAFFWALLYMYRLGRELIGEEAAAAAPLLLAAYPFALFYSAPYSESLFLLSALGAFYHFRREEWLAAAAWGLALGLTRPNGCFASVPLGVLALQQVLQGSTGFFGVLRGSVLRGSVLRGSVLRGSVLRGSVLRGSVLRGSVLRGSVPRGSVLPDSVPPGSVLPGSVPPGSVLPGSVPPGSVLPGSVPSDSVLPGSVPPGSVLPGSVLPGSVLPGSVPSGSVLPGSVPSDSVLPGSVSPGEASGDSVREDAPVGGVAAGGSRAGLALRLLVAAMPGVGMLLFTLYLRQLTGVWFAWTRSHEAWGRSFHGMAPFVTAYTWLKSDSLVQVVASVPYNSLNTAALLFALALVVPVFRRLGFALGVFVLINLVPPIFAGGVLSMGRLTATLFPLFLALAALVPARSVASWCLTFGIGQGLAAALFFTWRQLF